MGYALAEDYVIQVKNSPLEVNPADWDALLLAQSNPSPFMRHAYLAALHESGSASDVTGWKPHYFTVHLGSDLVAACAVYEKNHSYGEYVFDWSWANAFAQHGLSYYPKAVSAVPFTPVPGARLMARTDAARAALMKTMLQWCEKKGLSSLHLLFLNEGDARACYEAGLMLRHTVQFHWENAASNFSGSRTAPPDLETRDTGYANFDAFLTSLSQEKRKKIRQERRKVAEAGVSFRWARGTDITPLDWDFFYRCYERTYLEHGNAPYLNRDFFHRVADTMAGQWLLFVAERDGHPIASSLIAIDDHSTRANALNHSKVAYGRYWGALERVDCLHFEACYYQPLQWCIEHGYHRFEGGAQGEHKMARALMPARTTSAHWIAHPAFADAVARFLDREGQGIGDYMDDLARRSPFKQV